VKRVAIAVLATLCATPLWAVETQNESSATWSCSLDALGATLTLCKTAPNSNNRLYVTTIWAQSTTTTAGLMLIRHGKAASQGGAANCATDTVSLLPAAATVPRYGYPASTAAALNHSFVTPLEVPPGRDLCIIGTATNTATIHLGGQVRP
jgi:hypothetical protein